MKTTYMGNLYKVTFTCWYAIPGIKTRKKAVCFFITFICSLLFCSIASAQVTITAPSLTVNTCGNFPTNYAPLANIVISEKNTGDFSVGTNVTLVLSSPSNFEFQPGTGSVSYTSGANISAASINITATSVTITYSASNTNKPDALTISGLYVRGITGAATGQMMTRTGGSGVINGDVSGTLHATFTSQVLPTPSVTTATSQTSCTGSPTTISLTSNPAGASFSWTTANVNNATGASSGSGSSITQTLSSAGTVGSVDYVVTPTLNGCAGSATTITNTVNPTASVNAVSNQVVCSNSSTAAVSFSSPTTGGTITYNWTNNNPSIGLAGNGTGNIASFKAFNNSNAPVTATITVTPTYSNAGASCTGTSSTFTITVNPTAAMTGITDQFACVNTATQAITFNNTTSSGTVNYTWSNNNTTIGLASSGSGNLPSFVAKNSGLTQNIGNVTVTPVYTNAGLSCTGTPSTFNFTVNPVPTVNSVANQTICNNSSTAAVNFTSQNNGTITYSWTNNAPFIGLASSGTGNIPSFTGVNNATTPIIATITVTASYATGGVTCAGGSTTFTITVNPTTTMDDVNNQIICAQSLTNTVNFTSPTSGAPIVYNWTNSNTSIGLAGSGSGNIPAFITSNATSSPVTSTITVTPSMINGGKTCVGIPSSFTISINPLPVINPVTDITECNNGTISSVAVTGTLSGTSYSWTNDQTSIGLASAGSGNMPSFTAKNPGTAPVSALITLAGSATNQGVACSAVAQTFHIVVNPTIVPNAVSNQTVCNNSPTTAVTFSSNATGSGTVSYQWANDNTSIGLAASGTGDLPSFNATNNGNTPAVAHITVTPVYTYNGKSCSGTPASFTITVNPSAQVNAIADQIFCNNSTVTVAGFTTPTSGGTVTYNWSNNNTDIGLAANGTGNIPSFLTKNSGNSPISGTVTVTPVFSDGINSCTGNSTSFVITVNPTANVNPVSNQTICNNSATTAVSFSTTTSGPGTVSYRWANNMPSIGLAATGNGNIPSFTALNSGIAPVTATITVTAVYTNGSSSCDGGSQTFTITVNPSATVNAISNQTICNYTSTGAVNFGTSAVGGTVSYAWTNNTPSIGLAGSGNGNIPSFTGSNTTNGTLTASIQVIPTFANGISCPGTATNFTITVNPTPTVNNVPNQTLCSNTSTNPIAFSGNVSGTIYRWTNNTSSIGLALSGNGNIPSFTAMNSGSAAVNAMVTVTPTYTNGGASCNGSPQTITITVNPLPVPSLKGPNPICPNTTDVYTTETGMNNYTWTETGGTITAGGTSTDASATITWGNSTGVKTIYINYTDNNGCTGATSVTVANGTGSSPGLTGPAKVCVNSSSNVYTTESGKLNYSWNIPSGGTIISGGGSTDNTATVRWYTSGSGNVTVNYSDVGGCNAATPTSFPVTVNALPGASISGNTTVCLNSSTSRITFAGSTGTAPYTFTYNINGGANQTITTLSGNNNVSIDQPSTVAGTYSYNLLNVQEGSSIACSNTQRANATVVVKPLPTATISGTTAVCANTSSPSITFSGASGTAPYTFTYSVNGGGNQTVSTSSDSTAILPVNTSTAGSFQYKLISVTEGSANSCSQSQSGNATVTVNPLPTASISGTATVCIGSSSPNLTFTGSGGTAPYTFIYSINGGGNQTVTSTGNTATVAAPTNVAGTFTYTLLSVTDATSTACSQAISNASATIKVDSKPVGGTLSPDVITGACSGSNSGSITLSGQLGNVTRWEFSTSGGASWSTVSPNVTSTTLTYSNLTATSLYRAVLQNGVCTDTAVSTNTIVVVSPIFTPTVKYLPTLTICVGDSVNMTASGLSNDKTSIVDGSFDQANPAGWSVTNNGSSINFPANADNANVHPWSETNGPKTYFSGTADAITYNSQFDYKFAIANGAVTTTLETPVFSLVGTVSPTFDFYQAYNLQNGTIAKIEISTDGGAHYTGILAQYSPGTLGVPNQGFVHSFVPLTNYIGLDNLKVKFTYSSTTNSSWALDNLQLVNTFLPVSYQWHSEGTTYTTQSITVSPPVGTHVFDLITQTGLCSITTTELTVIVNGRPTITPGTSSVCNSSSAQTLTLPYTNPTYSPTKYSITWNSPSNGLASLSDTILSSSSIPVKIPGGVPAGTYSGTINVSNVNGCASPGSSFTITINQTPVITNQAPAAFCSTGSVTLNSSNFTGTNIIPANTTYTWAAPSVSGITGLASGNAQSSFSTGTLTNTTSQPVQIVYTVIPTSGAGCPGAPFTVTVTVNPTQIISTIPLNITLCPQPFSTISTSFSVTAAGATLFQWQENRGSGWVNLANGTNYSGVTTSTLTINNITEAMEGYQYRTSLSNPAYCYSTYSDASTLYITNVWKGTTSTDWATPSNWWGNVVPDINCQYVIVPTVSSKLYPILKGVETEEVRNIVIRQNALVTIKESATLKVRGAIYANIANYQYGTLDATDGKIDLTGGGSHTYLGTDTAQIIAGSLFKIRTLKDLQISNPLGATVQSTLNDTLNITGTLSFGNVNNTLLHTGDNITLVSNIDGTARVADITNNSANSGNNFDGSIIVERYIKSLQHGKSWEFLATPTKGQTIRQSWQENGTFASTGYGTQITSPNGTAAGFDLWSQYPSMKYYKEGASPNDPNSPDYQGVSNTGSQIYNANGYMLFIRGDRSIPGPFDPANATRMRTKGTLLTYTVTTPYSTTDKYTSIGNPYASSIDMTKVLTDKGSAIQSFVVWKSPDYGTYGYGSYITYNLVNGKYYSVPGNVQNNNIESGQAFFVPTIKGNSIVFNETAKTAGFDYTVFRNDLSGVQLLRTDLYDMDQAGKPRLADGTLVQFGQFSNKIDQMDTRKFKNAGLNLSIIADDDYFVVEKRQLPQTTDTIFMNLTGAEGQHYRYVFVATGLASTGMQPFLEDHYLNTVTPINIQDSTIINFQIDGSKGSRDAGRFDIIFREIPQPESLPFNFVSVSALKKGQRIEVDWSTLHQGNIQQYEIERSFDGVQFVKAGSVEARSADSASYSWMDENVLPGTYYYRIKSTDVKGKVTYSEKVKVLTGDGQSFIKIYPNPITDGIINLQFINQPAGKYDIRLMNHSGQLVVSKQIERMAGSDIQRMNWDYRLAHGAYHLEIIQPDGQVKIIKLLY
jgi:hypothetical protein